MDGKLNADLSEWMQGLPAGWTDVPGVSSNDRLRACGDCVVPQQAVAAYLDLFHTLTTMEAA